MATLADMAHLPTDIRQYSHGGPSEAGDCSHPPPKMATAENPTSGKGTFDNVVGRRSLRCLVCE